MTRRRWVAIAGCTFIVGAAIGLLSLVLYRVFEHGTVLISGPIAALVLLAAAPFVAAWASGRSTPLVAGGGGLALGIGATLAAAALDQGGTGALPLTMGIAVAAGIALDGGPRVVWGRLAAIVLLGVYAAAGDRLISAAFVYPAIGVADELVDSFLKRDGNAAKERSGAVSG